MRATVRGRAPQFGGEGLVHHRPRRRFAQNFLVDRSTIDRIVASIAPRKDEHVVEIGPGHGALTGQLAEQAGELVLVEIDRDLVTTLERQFPDVRVLSADALKVDYDTLFDPGVRYRVVGNLPYNISTPLIFRLLAHASRMQDAYFMLQDEVVARLSARPGQKAWGRLGVMVQYHCQVEPLFGVSPEAFTPKPQVRSRIVRLQPWDALPHPASDYGLFERLVRTAFSLRRKTLRNALKSLPDSEALVAEDAFDFSVRPENLDVADFVAISNALVRLRPDPDEER
ncbi:MAG: 16S rRNA (adenine(1518)-N(6)/adenine(1519)-N(6))-dimethyltransferase RsmA [Gammaproteobacteria bacterium]|nr:MAG: 16S rRNA (adenine(1518)-N(6)/adenine(1519)-N(6))-dimethyltransferase RsmA [Gammaproteobacteria bacterium]